MSSGGMDWAYRMVALHALDPLGGMIVLHLGWRDHPDFRTDRGIARALRQHRKSVQLATAKLAALGIIARRSGQWVAVETVRIVEGSPDAVRPGPASSDDEAAGVVTSPSSPRRSQFAGGGVVSSPGVAKSVRHYEKREKEKVRGPSFAPSRSAQRPRLPHESGGDVAALAASLSAFQRAQLFAGSSFQLNGDVVPDGSPLAVALLAAVRSARDAERRAKG